MTQRNDISAQEIFDKVCLHLRKQGVKSKNDIVCLLRDAHGRKCAIGALIDDNDYLPIMENFPTASDLCERFSALKFLKPHLFLLNELQEAHDSYEVSEWKAKFQSIARRYKLKMS